jgi:hypothetical protein
MTRNKQPLAMLLSSEFFHMALSSKGVLYVLGHESKVYAQLIYTTI